MSTPPIAPEMKAKQRERRMQVRGMLWLAAAVLVFSLWRAGLHRVFTVGWWRLW